MTSTAPKPPLRRALLHPVWLGAVATLAINDHLLKGSGLAPGWFTGKLSDVVGLFAAPLLLAVLLRVSSRRAWAVAHLAIGLVFSAIQLSSSAADAWSSLMGLFGFPWSITSDATDLLALPALAVSFVWVPTLARSRAARHTGEVVVACAGIAACMATSRATEGPLFSSFDADTYLHNANPYDIVLRIRPLASASVIDCDLAEEDPGGYLREPLFADASAWTLAPDATMPVLETWSREDRACHAVWIDADNLAPSIIFWREGQFPIGWTEGTGITPDTRGWISIEFDDDGRGTYETEEDLVFTIDPLPRREDGDVCTPSGPETRLAWGSLPAGDWRLGAADEGPDGCLQLDLRTGFENDLEQDGRPWELCLPSGAFPFQPGALLKFKPLGLGPNDEAVEIIELDALTGEAGTTMVAWKGDGASAVLGVQPIIDLDYGCTPLADDSCGTVRQTVSVSIAGGGFETASLTAGASVLTQSETETLEVHLVHASRRLIANTDCAGQSVGNDLELVAIRRNREGE